MKNLFLMVFFFALSLTNFQIALAKSDFSAAVLVDNQIITFYDINQKARLLFALTGEKKSDSSVKELLIGT